MEEPTYRLFMVATVGMLAGTVFLLHHNSAKPEHRRGVYISALVCGIACISLSEDGSILGKEHIDIGLRYVDWVLTVDVRGVLAVTRKVPHIMRQSVTGELQQQ